MANLLKLLPSDCILHKYLASRSIFETPTTFDLVCGLAAVGASLRRTCWVDQVGWKIYPNTSVLLVGPSGIGKDTAIDGAEGIINEIGEVRIIGGRTSEAIFEQMYQLGNPACAVVLAHELSAFFGRKDYQSGLLQDLTDLMSTKAYKDISNKGDLYGGRGGKRILKPTLSILGGSTAEWLHSSMPEGALDGGFFGRFTIVCEERPKRFVPLIKHSISLQEQKESIALKQAFIDETRKKVNQASAFGEVIVLNEANDIYANWYSHRERFFTPLTRAYAHRCRDHVLRLGMLCAVLRGHRYIDTADMAWSMALFNYVGSKLDTAVAPPVAEARCGAAIKAMLPASMVEIIRAQGQVYQLKQIKESLAALLEGRQINRTDNGLYKVV